MEKCQRCESDRIGVVSAKCSDMCYFDAPRDGIDEQSDYAPYGVGIGGGDYVRFSYCMTCGQIQGEFPVGIPDEEDLLWQFQEQLERVAAHEECRGPVDCIRVEGGKGEHKGKLRFFDNDGNETFLDVMSAMYALTSLDDYVGEEDVGAVWEALENGP